MQLRDSDSKKQHHKSSINHKLIQESQMIRRKVKTVSLTSQKGRALAVHVGVGLRDDGRILAVMVIVTIVDMTMMLAVIGSIRSTNYDLVIIHHGGGRSVLYK